MRVAGVDIANEDLCALGAPVWKSAAGTRRIGATLPGAAWQRCRTHYATNLMAVTRSPRGRGCARCCIRSTISLTRNPLRHSTIGSSTRCLTSYPRSPITSRMPAQTCWRSPPSPNSSGARAKIAGHAAGEVVFAPQATRPMVLTANPKALQSLSCAQISAAPARPTDIRELQAWSPHAAVAVMSWLRRKKFVGSYSVFNARSRSRLGPYASCRRSLSSPRSLA
jgi:hypothetical protein